ncbi:transglutaminase domain-containing protein [Paenibacillus sp. M1]|uniref:Transglutaminase domain-containing protein n=1 Tax=Paenibacillus haidiansis TaxID=1574488 RepID=A0ABU7VUY5_9BACL
MGQSMPKRWITASLAGALLLGNIPADWNLIRASAASEQAYATTVLELQQEVAEGLKARNTSMTIKYKGPTRNLQSLLKKAIEGALDSDPYTKYIVDRYTYSWRGTSGAAKIILSVGYRETAGQSAYVDQRAVAILQDIVRPEMNDHQKVKAIHDYVVQHLQYDKELEKYTAYEGLRSGEAVCQGYTLLAYKLLEKAGIANLIVEGTAGSRLHAWNLVKLDNRWYHLDTTWDDPLSPSGQQPSYKYYLLTDSQIRRDHNWKNKYPAASTLYRESLNVLASGGGAEAAEYETLKRQLGFQLYDQDAAVGTASELQNQVKRELESGGLTVTVRYAGTERRLVQDLGSLYDLSLANVRYLSEPLEGTDDLRVEIHWENR